MGGGATPVEKARLGKNGNAGADAGNQRALGVESAHPRYRGRILLQHDVHIGAS